jgi:hypothetical protein
VYEDGREIDRLREDAPAKPELAWYWTITVIGGPRVFVVGGEAPSGTFNQAEISRTATGRPRRSRSANGCDFSSGHSPRPRTHDEDEQ